MRRILSVVWLVLISGCSTPAKYVTFPVDAKISVTKAYSMPFHEIGDEFVFSVKLPRQDTWEYPSNSDMQRRGYLSVYAQGFKRELMIEWVWINMNSAMAKDVKANDPIYLPWHTGKVGTGERVTYVPTEEQMESGDWHRVGYPQQLFHQAVWVGKKKIYCVRSLFRRGGRTTWEQEQGAQDGAGYSVHMTCPFHTSDGRDAWLMISTGYGVSADEMKANPDVVEKKLAAVDELLQPLWDSLEVMPGAVQLPSPTPNKAAVR